MSDPTQSLRKSVLPRLASVADQPGIAPATVSTAEPFPASTSKVDAPGEASVAQVAESSFPGVSSSGADQAALIKPTEAQIRVKARFWARMQDQPLADTRTTTLASAQALTQSAALAGWWARPGFKDWFLSTAITDERLEYLLNLALSSAEDILLNTDPKAQSARVQMVKIVAEMSGKLRPTSLQGGPKDKDASRRRAIESMNREELVKFLADQGIQVQQVVTLPSNSEK